MRTKFLAFLFTMNSCMIVSQTQWKVTSSSVTFTIKNGVSTVQGSFGNVSANIKFDEINYGNGWIEAGVEIKTLNTGINLRNKHLKNESFFDEMKYSTITLGSTQFIKEKEGCYKGNFKLFIKGVTKEISIPFSYTETGNNATFKASFTVNRRGYNVGGSSWTMSDIATVNVVINAVK